MNWEFPNTQSWNFAGDLSADGTTITGVTSSIQGGVPLEFKKRWKRVSDTASGLRLWALGLRNFEEPESPEPKARSLTLPWRAVASAKAGLAHRSFSEGGPTPGTRRSR